MTEIYSQDSTRVTRSSGSKRATTLAVPETDNSKRGSKRATGRGSTRGSSQSTQIVPATQDVDMTPTSSAPGQLVMVGQFNDFINSCMKGFAGMSHQIKIGAENLGKVDAKVAEVDTKVSALNLRLQQMEQARGQDRAIDVDRQRLDITYAWSRYPTAIETARRFVAWVEAIGNPTVDYPKNLSLERTGLFVYPQGGVPYVMIHTSELCASQKDLSKMAGAPKNVGYDSAKVLKERVLQKLDAQPADFATSVYLFHEKYGISPFKIPSVAPKTKKSQRVQDVQEMAVLLFDVLAKLIADKFANLTVAELEAEVEELFKTECGIVLRKQMALAHAAEIAEEQGAPEDQELSIPEDWESNDKYEPQEDKVSDLISKIRAQVTKLIKVPDSIVVMEFDKLRKFYNYFAHDLDDLGSVRKLYDVSSKRVSEEKMTMTGGKSKLVSRQSYSLDTDEKTCIPSCPTGLSYCNEALNAMGFIQVIAALMWNNRSMTLEQAKEQVREAHVGAKWQICDAPILDMADLIPLQQERMERLNIVEKKSAEKKAAAKSKRGTKRKRNQEEDDDDVKEPSKKKSRKTAAPLSSENVQEMKQKLLAKAASESKKQQETKESVESEGESEVDEASDDDEDDDVAMTAEELAKTREQIAKAAAKL